MAARAFILQQQVPESAAVRRGGKPPSLHNLTENNLSYAIGTSRRMHEWVDTNQQAQACFSEWGDILPKESPIATQAHSSHHRILQVVHPRAGEWHSLPLAIHELD